MKTVILESPFASGLTPKDLNIAYANQCMYDCIKRGEAPFASHLLYPAVLDDNNAEERILGIKMGYAWWTFADHVVFYTDLGWSNGMIKALQLAVRSQTKFWIRSLKGVPQMPPVISDPETEQSIQARLDRSHAEDKKNDRETEEAGTAS